MLKHGLILCIISKKKTRYNIKSRNVVGKLNLILIITQNIRKHTGIPLKRQIVRKKGKTHFGTKGVRYFCMEFSFADVHIHYEEKIE